MVQRRTCSRAQRHAASTRHPPIALVVNECICQSQFSGRVGNQLSINLQAQNRRSIPRQELEKMPAAGTTRVYESAVTMFLRANDATQLQLSASDKLETAKHRALSSSQIASASHTASSKPNNVWELSCEVWQEPALVCKDSLSNNTTAKS